MNVDVVLLRKAYGIAARCSDDPKTQNGAVLVGRYGGVLAESANVFPEGVRVEDTRLVSPAKYSYMVHAECGVIYAAARFGLRIKGSTLYVPWFACTDCAKAIIQSGIVSVVGHRQCLDKTPERWRETIAQADAMLDEAGVKRRYVDGDIQADEVKFNGEVWSP